MPTTVTTTDDANAYAWASFTDTFDDAGALVSRLFIYDDGHELLFNYGDGLLTSSVLSDPTDVATWNRIETSFDATGAMTSRTLTLDTGLVSTTTYVDGVISTIALTDASNIFNWISLLRTYAATGALGRQDMTMDDGRVVTTTYTDGHVSAITLTDAAGVESWTSIVRNYDAAGALTSTVVTDDRGLVTTTEYDASGARAGVTLSNIALGQPGAPSWSQMESTYDPDTGALLSKAVTSPDGRIVLTEYDASGDVTKVTVTDGGDDKAWTTIETTYNAAGQRAHQTITFDDGRVVENRIVNTDPDAQEDDAVAVQSGGDVTIDVLANDSDADGDALSLTAFSQGTYGSVTREDNGTPDDLTDDRLVYNPGSSHVGMDTFTYAVADGYGGETTVEVSVNVLPSGTVLLQEGFETDGDGSRYALSNSFSDGFGDFFTRTDGSDVGSIYQVGFAEGNFYLAAMDLDGEGGSGTETLTFTDVDISGYENLSLSFMLAEDDDGANQDWDDDTSFRIEVSIDGADYVTVFAVEAAGGTNTEPLIDTDFDGIGDGTALTSEFQTFMATIAETGSSMDIRVVFENLDAGDEDIAFDNLVLVGDPAPVPLPDGVLAMETFDYAELGLEASFTLTDSNGDALFFAEDTSYDYFGIFDGDGDGGADFKNDAAPGSFNAYGNADDNYLGGSDIDGGDPSIVEPVYLTYTGLDISAYSELMISADLATEDGDTGLDSEDFISFEVRIDGGAWVPVMAFETADDSSYNLATFLQDTDFDGIGDGAALTSDFQTFTDTFDATGSTLDFRVGIHVDASREDFGIDNIKIMEVPVAQPQISEFEPNQAGSDPTTQQIELTGEPGTEFTGWIVSIESDGGISAGTVDRATQVAGFFDADGRLVVTIDDLENLSNTLVLSSDFTGAVGDDLDADNDGSIDDASVFGTVYDAIGIVDNVADEATAYGADLGGIDFGYSGAEPERMFRDGTTGDWVAVNILNGSDPYAYDADGNLLAIADFDSDPSLATNFGVANETFLGTPEAPAPDIMLISAVQGDSGASPVVGEIVAVSAIVTYTMADGFFVQEEITDSDGNPITSEGVFVFTGGVPTVELGDLVEVTGTVSEYFGRTQITASDIVVVSHGNALPDYTSIALDPASGFDYETVEGMLVSVDSGTTDPLTLITNFNLDRYGEFWVSAGVQTQPTQIYDAQTELSEILALAEANENARLLIDDGSSQSNPSEFQYIPNTSAGDNGNGYLDAGDTFDAGGATFRLGTEFTAPLTGVMDFGFSEYRLQLDDMVQIDETTNSGARPVDAPDVGGDIQVASFNVLNYFTSFSGGDASNPAGQARGATSPEDLARQAAKLAAAIFDSGAEVVALQELENNGDMSDAAIEALVLALEAEATARGLSGYDWQFVTTGLGYEGPYGTDAITTGMIYNAAEVTLNAADYIVFDEASGAVSADLAGLSATQFNRPSIGATFTDNDTGATFTVVSVHFKSKGDSGLASAVETAQAAVDAGTATADQLALLSDPNIDQGNGQGYWNQVRTDAAQELMAWLEGTNAEPADNYLGTGVENGGFIILGDFNAYSEEDPTQVFADDPDYVDLIEFYVGTDAAYSYVFDGQRGALDQAIASDDLAAFVTGVAEWHINADEPDLLSYSSRFNDAGFYGDDVFAASDHDPIIVGLDFGATLTV